MLYKYTTKNLTLFKYVLNRLAVFKIFLTDALETLTYSVIAGFCFVIAQHSPATLSCILPWTPSFRVMFSMHATNPKFCPQAILMRVIGCQRYLKCKVSISCQAYNERLLKTRSAPLPDFVSNHQLREPRAKSNMNLMSLHSSLTKVF